MMELQPLRRSAKIGVARKNDPNLPITLPKFQTWGSGTLKTPQKFDPPGGPDYSTANSKSKLPKYIG